MTPRKLTALADVDAWVNRDRDQDPPRHRAPVSKDPYADLSALASM